MVGYYMKKNKTYCQFHLLVIGNQQFDFFRVYHLLQIYITIWKIFKSIQYCFNQSGTKKRKVSILALVGVSKTTHT